MPRLKILRPAIRAPWRWTLGWSCARGHGASRRATDKTACSVLYCTVPNRGWIEDSDTALLWRLRAKALGDKNNVF